MNTNIGRLRAAGLVAAGLVAGGVLAISGLASASTTSTPTTSGTTTSTSPAGPGVQENDGIPEASEHHGFALRLPGTVTAVGTDSVTIKTASGTTTYSVTSASDIDKNGEATLSSLAVGDAVRFSVNGTTIDKLHAGSESLDRPAGAPHGPIGPGGPDGSHPAPSGTAGSGTPATPSATA